MKNQEMLTKYGYESPMNSILRGIFTSILTQLFYDENYRGTIGFDTLPYMKW
jgi:hypothetical protein